MGLDGIDLPNLEKCSVILLDVAGTTTSINFVKETLLPFAVKEAAEFLKTNWEDEAVKKCVDELNENGKEDEKMTVESATELVKSLTEKGGDNKGLKTLQGMIYEKGYKDGQLKGHVFADVAECFDSWTKLRRIAIYSTGSIESQKLLFTNSTEGDLSKNISHYFDQTVGSKTEADSYKKIVEELKTTAEEILFISDNVDEVKAAKTAGIISVLVKREGNAEISEDIKKEFSLIDSFKDLALDACSKRKNTEEPTTPSEEPPSKVAKTDETAEKADAKEPEGTEKMDTEETTTTAAKDDAVAEKTDGENEKAVLVETIDTDSKKTDKAEEETQKSEEKVEETEEKMETESEKPTEKLAEEVTKEEKVEAVESQEAKIEEKVEEKKETVKTDEDTEKKMETDEQAKVEEKEDKALVDEKTEEKEEGKSETAVNGESTENAESTAPTKVEEKENKSQLANGVENNGKNSEEVATEEVANETNEDAENASKTTEETEVKVKKLDETTESTAVSVSV